MSIRTIPCVYKSENCFYKMNFFIGLNSSWILALKKFFKFLPCSKKLKKVIWNEDALNYREFEWF